MRKGEIACNRQFLLFSECFLSYMVLNFPFYMHFKICFNLDQSKILRSGNGLSKIHLGDTVSPLLSKYGPFVLKS